MNRKADSTAINLEVIVMKERINAMVYCRNNEYGKLDFYLKVRENSMYLFTTDFYSHSIHDEYYNGKRLDAVFIKTSMIRQQKLRERIIRMAKYAAAENEITLFSKSKKQTHRKSIINYDYEIV